MIKSMLIGLNILGLLLVGFIQKSDLKITQNLPISLNPGEEAVVTVNIDKSDVSGFAKFQVSLAPGLRAEMVDNAGASFTFNDQKAKFIWMALPTVKSFSLKYRIIADKDAVGNLSVDARFSYIYQNERKNFDAPQATIAVGDANSIAAERIKSSIEEKASNASADISVNRTVTSVGINQWKVNIIVDKTGIQGFGKIEETIPEGYTVIDLKSSSAVFSVNDKTIKYIWYDIPENENVVVTYKMLPVIAMNGITPKITGDFSYLKNEETVTIPINGGVGEPKAEPEEILAETTSTTEAGVVTQEIDKSEKAAENIDLAENKPKEVVVTELPKTTTTDSASKTPKVTPSENKNELAEAMSKTTIPAKKELPQETLSASAKSKTDGNIVDVPEPETGVFYRVQIAAGKNNLKQPVFAKLYRFDEKFNIENQDGLFKYTTGHFQVYKAARDGRVRITTKYDKFKGPFVTAYNSGERITVQEALMITSQKWYQ